jgi:hypothetical protein
MADEPRDWPIERPTQPPPKAAKPVDEGLAAWANLVHDHLTTQSGVQIIGKAGGSVHFQFRGQTFAVHIHRTS